MIYFYKQKQKLFCFFTFMLIPILGAQTSLAHSAHGGEAPIEVYENLLHKISQLDIQDTDQNAAIGVSFKEPGFFIGKKWVAIDNAFWDLTNHIAQMYLRELHTACEDCTLPNPQDLELEAKNLIARGWLEKKGIAIKDAILYRYVGEFTGLGARYGFVAGAAKVAGELMEDALLVIFKMPGAHFLCEAITLFISYNAKTVFSYARSWSYASYFNSNSLINPIRLAVTSYYVRKSLKKAQLEVPEFTIDFDELHHLKEESPDKKWIYRLTNTHRMDQFLKILDKKIKKLKSQNKDTEELKAILRFRSKIYNGKRFKRFFLLKKRNSALTLSSFSPDLRPLTKGSHFWLLEVKNESLGSITKIEGKNEVEQLKKSLANEELFAKSQQDITTRTQLAHFSDRQSQMWAASIFKTIDEISNPQLTRKKRLFQLQFMESFIGHVVPHIFNEIAEHSVEELPTKERSFKDVFAFQWRMNKIMRFTDQFVDIMRIAAISKSVDDITFKFHARDYFLLLLKTYNSISTFEHFDTKAALQTNISSLSDQLENLQASQFWVEKRTQPTLIPNWIQRLGLARPRCESIYTH